MEHTESSKLSPVSTKLCILKDNIMNLEKDMQEIRKKIELLESDLPILKDFAGQTNESHSVEKANLLGDDVILVCQRMARNNVRCFVRNLMRQLFEPCHLREFSLSGRSGRKKVPKYILDFVLEQSKQKFPESSVKTVLFTCGDVFSSERCKLKKVKK